jgi:flagellum-specific peptidoglycan hydrolase FlgJ
MTEAYKKAGVSDNGIKNLIAKNAFESGWGNSAQGAYNFGNITAGSKWDGDYYDGKDVDADGNPITNRFRVYSDLDSYVKDELQFLTSLYDFDSNDDFETFAKKL